MQISQSCILNANSQKLHLKCKFPKVAFEMLAASEDAIVSGESAQLQAVVAENQLEAGQLVEHPYQHIKY